MFRGIQLPSQRNLVSWASRAEDDFCARVTEAVLYAGRRVGGTKGNCTRCDRSFNISCVRGDSKMMGCYPPQLQPSRSPTVLPHVDHHLGQEGQPWDRGLGLLLWLNLFKHCFLGKTWKDKFWPCPNCLAINQKNAFLVHKRSPKTNVLNFELFLGCLYIFLPSSAFFAYIIFLWGF